MKNITLNNTAYEYEQSIKMPKGTTLSASEFSKIAKPTANYFGAGLNSLTSYLDE